VGSRQNLPYLLPKARGPASQQAGGSKRASAGGTARQGRRGGERPGHGTRKPLTGEHRANWCALERRTGRKQQAGAGARPREVTHLFTMFPQREKRDTKDASLQTRGGGRRWGPTHLPRTPLVRPRRRGWSPVGRSPPWSVHLQGFSSDPSEPSSGPSHSPPSKTRFLASRGVFVVHSLRT
jgi:hypothetical protein